MREREGGRERDRERQRQREGEGRETERERARVNLQTLRKIVIKIISWPNVTGPISVILLAVLLFVIMNVSQNN